MRLDLYAVGLEGQAKAQRLGCFNHFSTKGFPVKVRPGRQMGVVVADCAIHFGQQGYRSNLGPCSNQAHHHIGNFLANSGRAGGLAMGAAQHRFCGIGLRHLTHLGNHFVQRGEQNQVAAAFEL